MLTNAEMKPNRFYRWHEARKLYNSIMEHLQSGGVVQVCTYTKATNYTQKHVDWFKYGKTGVYVRRGKSWDCIDGASIRFGRYV